MNSLVKVSLAVVPAPPNCIKCSIIPVYMQVIHEYDIVLIQEILMKDDLFKSFVEKNVNQNLPIKLARLINSLESYIYMPRSACV